MFVPLWLMHSQPRAIPFSSLAPKGPAITFWLSVTRALRRIRATSVARHADL